MTYPLPLQYMIPIALGFAVLSGQPPLTVRPGSRPVLFPASISADARLRVWATNIRPDGTIATAPDLYSSVQGVVMQTGRKLAQYGDAANGDAGRGVISASVTPTTHGTIVAYIAQAAQNAPEEIHVIETNSGADKKILTDLEGCQSQPGGREIPPPCLYSVHISPDESSILYAAGRGRPFSVAPVDGGAVTKLAVMNGELAPSWQRVIAQDGTVVFTSADPASAQPATAANVYVMKLDGTGIRALTHFPTASNIITRNATISNDGLTVAFESSYGGSTDAPNGNSRVYIIRTDGSGLQALTDGRSPAGSLTLSGNGSTVLYVQDQAVWKATAEADAAPVLVQKYQWSALQTPVLAEDGESFVAALGPDAGRRGAIDWFATTGGVKSIVYAPNTIFPDGITSAALGSPAAGSLIAVYGFNLGSEDKLLAPEGTPLPLTLCGISLLVNDRPVPLVAITRWQINAQMPFESSGQNVTVRVSFDDGKQSAAASATVRAIAPALFVSAAYDGSTSYWQAGALHAGTKRLADANAPAVSGETLELYGTGLGPVRTPVAAGTGSPADPPDVTSESVQAQVGGVPAMVTFAGLAAGLVGVYQVNVVVPAGMRPGRQSVILQVGSVTSVQADILVA